MTIADKLKNLTKLMHKAWVAKRAGITTPTLDSAMSGRRIPSIDTCRKLATALEVDAGWLMDDTKEWPPVRNEQQAVA